MKKILLVSTILLSLLSTNAAAQTATQSSSTTVEEIQKSLSERIKKAIQGDLNDQSEPKLKAFVGTVSSIADNTITITTTTGSAKQLVTSPQTEIVRSGNKVKFEAIKISEGIIGMGLTTDLETQESLRIVLFEPTIPKFQRS